MTDQETHLIHSFPRNSDEEIHIAIRRYNDKYYIDLRIWFLSSKNEGFRPTKKGIIFAVEHLEEFKKGIERLSKNVAHFCQTTTPVTQ